jgi:hypothetical protein
MPKKKKSSPTKSKRRATDDFSIQFGKAEKGHAKEKEIEPNQTKDEPRDEFLLRSSPCAPPSGSNTITM